MTRAEARAAEVRTAPLSAERADDYFRFFDARAFVDNPRWAGCYCYFPLHDPEKTDWHARTGEENRRAVAQCIAGGRASGYLAYDGDDVIGWCNVGPWSQYPMLHDEPEAGAESIGVIFCFVIAPEFRGRGVARPLLSAACLGLRAQGLAWVYARPLRQAHGAAANHLGPLSMYLRAGFEIVREDAEGHVIVRKPLL
jgi:ribosomal protein S18 acetylase RimI-like enzyme